MRFQSLCGSEAVSKAWFKTMVLWSWCTSEWAGSCSFDCNIVQWKCFDMLLNARKAGKIVLQTFMSVHSGMLTSLIV